MYQHLYVLCDAIKIWTDSLLYTSNLKHRVSVPRSTIYNLLGPILLLTIPVPIYRCKINPQAPPTSTKACRSLHFVRAFGGGGFLLLLVVSVSVDVAWGHILVRVSGRAKAKQIRDGDELELEDVGMKEAAPAKLPWYLFMINRFRTTCVGCCVGLCS